MIERSTSPTFRAPAQQVQAPTASKHLGTTLRRVWQEVSEDNLSLVSAGVAFYAFLSLVPALSAVISIWGLFATPERLQAQLVTLQGVVPPNVFGLLREQMQRVAETNSNSLGFGALGSALVSLWISKKGVEAIIDATHISYDEEDERSLVRRTLVALGLTVVSAVVFVLTVGLALLVPLALAQLGIATASATLFSVLRWPLLGGIVFSALCVLYRLTPRRVTRWREVLPGASIAALAWLVLSAAFSLYASEFANYQRIYGSLGAVVALLLWLWLSSYIVLVGAELNSEVYPSAQSAD
ncbi:MAG: YihY/virulence factor BrkB family protein [Polyangiaceae bacterium]